MTRYGVKSVRNMIQAFAGLALIVTLAGCGSFGGDADYPTATGRDRYSPSGGNTGSSAREEDGGGGLVLFGENSIFGGGFGGLFGGNDEEGVEATGDGPAMRGGKRPALGVNHFLWRASLDTVSFMPLASADPFGGVIITDWYSDPAANNERFKITVYILDKGLRADGVRVSVFRQEKDFNGGWKDAGINPEIGVKLENAILVRARELKVGAAN